MAVSSWTIVGCVAGNVRRTDSPSLTEGAQTSNNGAEHHVLGVFQFSRVHCFEGIKKRDDRLNRIYMQRTYAKLARKAKPSDYSKPDQPKVLALIVEPQ